jgi:hypothetical protein
MKNHEWTIRAMKKYGRKFEQRLADAWMDGDDVGRQRIGMAFPDVLDRHAAMGAQMRDEDEALAKMEGRAES